MSETVYFSLGSNQGDRLAFLEKSLDRLAEICPELAASRIYETEPMHVPGQPLFLNAVARGRTALAPPVLLERLKEFEAGLGRRPGPRFGPRSIDIDILLYGGEVIATEHLVIPHPRMKDRRFVLVPLLELDPELRDPVSGRPYREALAAAPAGGVYFHACSRYTVSSLTSADSRRPPDPGAARK